MRSFMATWWRVTSFVRSAQLAVLAPTPGLTTPYWHPSIFKRGRVVMSRGMELLRRVECPQRSAGEQLHPRGGSVRRIQALHSPCRGGSGN
jgi:hypothetical protein